MFFEDVRLADEALIGNEGSGWEQVNAELAFERSGPERIYSSIVLLEHWIDCLRRSPNAAGQAEAVGRFATHLATLRNMSIAVTNKLASGESPVVEAALVKDIGTTGPPSNRRFRRRWSDCWAPTLPPPSMPTCLPPRPIWFTWRRLFRCAEAPGKSCAA